VIAQCLAAAHKSVPSDFLIHSMHCYFVLAGNPDVPVIYHVERIRSGRSFATRTVQARQKGKVIFTTTMSFMKEGSGGKKLVEHFRPMPFVPGPEEDSLGSVLSGDRGPVISRSIDIWNNYSPYPHSKRCRQWIKATGRISDAGGHEAHLAALAYMSDNYFIGTVSRVHKLWRIPARQDEHKAVKVDEDVRKVLRVGDDSPSKESKPDAETPPVVSMMVSLDHSIYFHDVKGFRSDDWIFAEMESPWAGDGRGLVIQRMYTKEGKLIASCVQEGVVRLKQDESSKL